MFNLIKIFIKRFSDTFFAKFQSHSLSFREHNKHYESNNKYEYELECTKNYYLEDLANSSEFRLSELLEKNLQLSKIAVDIGSGTGWLSGWLSSYFDVVYSIEPSERAIELAKEIQKEIQNSSRKIQRIKWQKGFAEDVLISLKLDHPTLFTTGRVLSHIADKDVKKIIRAIDNIAPVSSVVCFAELWGEDYHRPLWHVRTKEWWTKQFGAGWELFFLDNPVEIDGRYVGIHAIKHLKVQ
jgi:SAM-dependent methyltransferase